MYAKLPRKQVKALLEAIDVPHDELVCHRDGTFTIRQHYFYGGDHYRRRMVGPLQRYTHATILRAREVFWTRETVVEVHFAFEQR